MIKEKKLYKKHKYFIDKRESEAKPIDSSRKFTIKSLLVSEVSGIIEINHIFTKLFEKLQEKCKESKELQAIFDGIFRELKHEYQPASYFQAIDFISKNAKT